MELAPLKLSSVTLLPAIVENICNARSLWSQLNSPFNFSRGQDREFDLVI